MNRLFSLFFVLFFFTIGLVSYGQSTDLARIEYTFFPQSNSDNSFRRFRSFINFPIKLNDNGAYLVPGIDYENINLKYEDPALFGTEELERFQSFTFSLGYTFKINEQWRFGTDGGVKVASNFERSDIIVDDLIYTGGVYFINIKEDERYVEPVRLILGLHYSTTSGIPFPLPIINYYKRFQPKWAYALGVPKTNLKYYINEKNTIQGFVTLDGFFANIQKNFDVDPSNIAAKALAENISMTILLAGIGYEHKFTDNLSFYLYAGQTLINNIRLRDDKREKVYIINETNSFYGRGGLKFSIL
ncbi:DUF6268 family outer membrane beta-barrel protein [Gillisia limnaea]|uniref:DUF6268 domain-containing protein n=1 Tax=Gillisia limnaea (strain DSM 15749 / LMG 21470 / R-8282) TaxID=865937 RepID=H2BSP6_GILLR|nr:DUF6268 family outer membrane beta-barrel protein [Gillisia limnaea]EHQ03632.1 hypothetical protein Gilli_3022 [Gillisia limnaea DSM 15749]